MRALITKRTESTNHVAWSEQPATATWPNWGHLVPISCAARCSLNVMNTISSIRKTYSKMYLSFFFFFAQATNNIRPWINRYSLGYLQNKIKHCDLVEHETPQVSSWTHWLNICPIEELILRAFRGKLLACCRITFKSTLPYYIESHWSGLVAYERMRIDRALLEQDPNFWLPTQVQTFHIKVYNSTARHFCWVEDVRCLLSLIRAEQTFLACV